MPELPEVEHAARCLRRWLRGRVVVRAEAGATRVFRPEPKAGARTFVRTLPGRRLERIDRKGKLLLLRFDGDVGVLAHLGMTGRWVLRREGEEPPRHSRARLVVGGSRGGELTLHYDDPRLFGRIQVVEHPGDLLARPEARALGPDPLVDGLDAAALALRLAKTTRSVKVALMDQAVIAGVGNILATEALYRAKIHPSRPGRSLDAREVAALARGIHASIAHGLSTMEGDDDVLYLEMGGEQENPFLAYDRAGERCRRCRRGVFAKLTLGGRTSAFCPECQPRGRRRRDPVATRSR